MLFPQTRTKYSFAASTKVIQSFEWIRVAGEKVLEGAIGILREFVPKDGFMKEQYLNDEAKGEKNGSVGDNCSDCPMK